MLGLNRFSLSKRRAHAWGQEAISGQHNRFYPCPDHVPLVSLSYRFCCFRILPFTVRIGESRAGPAHHWTGRLLELKDFRKKLYGHDFPTRKHAYAVALLLGHSGPDISVEHYIHSFDWILSSYLASGKNAPTKREVVLASGRPPSTVYSWLGPLPEATRQLFESRYPETTQISRTEGTEESTAGAQGSDLDEKWV